MKSIRNAIAFLLSLLDYSGVTGTTTATEAMSYSAAAGSAYAVIGVRATAGHVLY